MSTNDSSTTLDTVSCRRTTGDTSDIRTRALQIQGTSRVPPKLHKSSLHPWSSPNSKSIFTPPFSQRGAILALQGMVQMVGEENGKRLFESVG